MYEVYAVIQRTQTIVLFVFDNGLSSEKENIGAVILQTQQTTAHEKSPHWLPSYSGANYPLESRHRRRWSHWGSCPDLSMYQNIV